MKIFKEFILNEQSIAEQVIYLPSKSEVLSITKTTNGLALIVLTKYTGYDNEPSETHKFKICATEEIFYSNTVKYIGSFESSLGIRHVIEVS